MKQKIFLSFLALAFGMASSSWALEKDANGVYQISTKQDLFDFATKVNNENELNAKAVLTKNIDLENDAWIPIGNNNKKYSGTFDGQGYAISNFNYTATSDGGNGLFGYVRNATIKNFSIDGTLTSTGYTYNGTIGAAEANTKISGISSAINITVANKSAHTGGILGSTVTSGNPVLVEGCEYSGILTHSETGDCQAGILGYTYDGGVKNCIFSGTIIGASSKYGGILGYCRIPSFLGVQNCLSIGKIIANNGNTTAAAIIANWNGNPTQNVKNNYYCLKEGSTTSIAIGNKANNCTAPVSVTAEQLASGEICYLLNGSVSGGENWYQTLGATSETYPKPYGNNKVFAKHKECDGTAFSDYTNDESDNCVYKEGFCPNCGFPQSDYMTKNSKEYYEISNEYELRWFSAYVNNIDSKSNAILTSNINLEHVDWTPIGNSSSKYAGTFDGQGHAIRNFNYTATSDGGNGLFGNIKKATIKNFSIDGTLTCENGSSGSGVVGWSDGSTIRDIHSSLKINATSGTIHHVGGIVGSARYSNQGTTVERCSFSGTMNVNSSSHDCFGGIAGYTNDYCVFNSCINSGTIEYSKKSGYVGGIVGYINNTSCKGPHNCLNIGSVIYKGTGTPDYGGAIVGRLNGHDENKLGDNYWKTGSAAYAGRGNGQNALLDKTHEVTVSQLASGEVTYNLGSAFYQTIGIDEVPVLDNTHGIVKKITDAKFATTYFDGTDVAIPDGVTAYAAAVNDNKVVLNAIDEKIAADDAVVLNGEEGYYSFIPTTGASKAANNDLKISDGNVATDASNKIYALAKNGTKVGFRIVGEGVKVPAGKAYLKVAVSAGVKEFYPFVEEDATGIASLLLETGEGVSVYNLAGQKLSRLQKGINIVDGKKVLF